MLIVLFISITHQFSLRKLAISDSEIRITIKGNGTKYILNNKNYTYNGFSLQFID